MTPPKAHKPRLSRGQRFLRLLGSIFDPRAIGHMAKIVNFYNTTHVVELRQARRGTGLHISPTASFANGRNIEIGNRVHIGAGSFVWAGPGRGRIILGDDALIAPGVMLTAANYRFNDGSPINDQAMDEADITIGRDVWLGYGAVVLAGASIGDGAIVGAGAVVRDSIPPGAIVAGNPARVIGQRTIRTGDVHVIARDVAADRDLLRLIADEVKIDPARLDLPLDEAGIDSFDLISLRMAIEARLGVGIPDREWAGIGSVSDIARLPSLSGGAKAAAPARVPEAVASAQVRLAPAQVASGKAQRHYMLNMPQMALSGLGESWLFKELGDIHWAMITTFLQSPSSGIADETGDRLYATFTRILLEATPSLRGFRENDLFDISSSLERYGAGMFFGTHHVNGPQATCRARTMSTFAKYGERGENTSLIKGTPLIPDPEALPSLDTLPEFGAEYRTRRAADPGPAIFECDYEILPPHDINGVGLLYFAAYPTVFDLCFERFEGKGFLLGHSTVSKDILYFANSEPTETLVFRLHAREMEDGLLRHTASLSRKSDGKRMSEITSLKRPLA